MVIKMHSRIKMEIIFSILLAYIYEWNLIVFDKVASILWFIFYQLAMTNGMLIYLLKYNYFFQMTWCLGKNLPSYPPKKLVPTPMEMGYSSSSSSSHIEPRFSTFSFIFPIIAIVLRFTFVANIIDVFFGQATWWLIHVDYAIEKQ